MSGSPRSPPFPRSRAPVCSELRRILQSHDVSVGEEGRASVRHAPAATEVEVLEAGAPSGDHPEPAVRHPAAVVEVEVPEAGTPRARRLSRSGIN